MKSKRILIVEDDRAVRETLAEILESEGYEVIKTSNGQEGIEALKNKTLPDLILLDLMMPIMDGFAFRKNQLENPIWAKIAVVVMSAAGNLNEKIKQMGGKLSALKKPPDLDDILSAVQTNIEISE